MNAKKFSDAMSELDSKYVTEAASYRKKAKKPGWIRWGALAACMILLCAAVIGLFAHSGDGQAITPGVADAAPMVYVNGTLYKQNTKQISYEEMKEEFIYLGKIESDVTNDQSMTDGIPKENFQANHPIVGAEVYQYDGNIVILFNGRFWLYEPLDNGNSKEIQNGLSEGGKMKLDPAYQAGE